MHRPFCGFSAVAALLLSLALVGAFARSPFAMNCCGCGAGGHSHSEHQPNGAACPHHPALAPAPAPPQPLWFSGSLTALKPEAGYLELRVEKNKNVRFEFDRETGFDSKEGPRALRKGQQITILAIPAAKGKLKAKLIRRGGQENALLSLRGLETEHCVKVMQGALEALAGVDEARVSLSPPQAQVRYDPAKVKLEDLRRAVEKAGYKVESAALMKKLPPATTPAPTPQPGHQH